MALILCGALYAPGADPVRTGGERVIYRDKETGRTVWRMTVSKSNDKHGYYSSQSWNADMTKIVWSTAEPQATRGSIWVMDADGSNFRKLADGVPYNMHTGANASWSRDGRKIYYGQRDAVDLWGRKVERPPDDNVKFDRSVYEQGPIRITNEMCYRLSPHKKLLDAQPAAIRNPKWSPDHKTFMIGYSNEYENPDTLERRKPTVKELYLIDANGRNFRRLDDYAHHHSWTADSKSIIFAAHDGLVMEAADGSSRRVISKVTGTHPSINPKGTLVVTDVYTATGDYLALIHVRDGRVEKLVNTPRTHPRNHKQTHTHPMWSPDGTMVMYDSDESGVCQIYIVLVEPSSTRTQS
ncbi:MAG: TolB family protein [Bryobacteraceae bacterium]